MTLAVDNFLKGSKWRKWDLHVHTPASYLNNQFGDDWDKYVQTLFKIAIDKGIAVLGITDYFTIDGYKKIKEDYLAKPNKLQELFAKGEIEAINKILVIPNVEFRLNKFVGDRSINFHVLFSEDVPNKNIEENFLHDLDFVYEGNPQNTEEKSKLKISNLAALGKKLKTQHEKFQQYSDIYVGMMNAVVDDSQISNILDGAPSRFKGKYLIGLAANEDLSDIEWDSRDHQTRKVLIQKSDFLFTANLRTREWALGKPPYLQGDEKFVEEFKCLKPCLHGSDAHALNEIGYPCIYRGTEGHNCGTNSEQCLLRHTWIKSDTAFEGLKQITYEPELRVRIQQDDPSEEEAYAKIEQLEVDFPNDLKIKDKESNEESSFCIKGKQGVSFSSNLTCIIGGRGSGKSTIVHMLYNLVPQRDAERLSEVNSPLFNLQLCSKDELGKIRSLTKSDIPASTEFFLQNEVEKFAKDINEMSKLVKTRLYGLSTIDDTQRGLQQIENEWQSAAVEVNGLISAYDEITRINQQIELIKRQKETLKKQTDVISSEEYKKLQKDIEEIANTTSAFDTYEKEYKRISVEISILIKSISRLNWSKYEGQSILTYLSTELVKKKAELQESFYKAKKDHDSADYTTKMNEKKTQLKQFLKDKGLSSENIGEVAIATQQISELEEQTKIFHQEKIPYQEVYDRKIAVFQAYNEAYTSYKKEFEAVAGKLQSSLSNLKFDDQQTNIIFKLKTNDQLLKGKIAEFIKDNNRSKVTLRSDDIQRVVFGSIQLCDLISDQSKIIEAVGNSEVADAHTQIIQELVNDPVFLEKLHLRMQGHYCDISNIQVQTKLGDKLLQNTSFGERCGIVIAIVLVAGTNPIIIDQPEDNLDGKYVTKVLVPLIRGQKQKRQIILVTRDANIAIGGDSELILILDKEGQGTALLPATIENKIIRSKYIWILDGGEKAFQKREAKYCINKTA
ncbi:MAG: hypothetical protein WC628_04270 [Candidatus Omnitrophota bacterium]